MESRQVAGHALGVGGLLAGDRVVGAAHVVVQRASGPVDERRHGVPVVPRTHPARLSPTLVIEIRVRAVHHED
jgi:hypothetical protein